MKVAAAERQAVAPSGSGPPDNFGEKQIAASRSHGSWAERSTKLSATTWMTRPARCSRAAHGEKTRRHHRAAVFVENFRPDDDVGDVGLVFERHEHDAFRRARPLPHQHEAGDGDRANPAASASLRSSALRIGAERGRGGRGKTAPDALSATGRSPRNPPRHARRAAWRAARRLLPGKARRSDAAPAAAAPFLPIVPRLRRQGGAAVRRVTRRTDHVEPPRRP